MRYFIVSNPDVESGEYGWVYEHDEAKNYSDGKTIEVNDVMNNGVDIFKHGDLCEITKEEYYSVYHAEDGDKLTEATDLLIKKYKLD